MMLRMPMTNTKITSSECRNWKDPRRWSPHPSLGHHRMVVAVVVVVFAAEDHSHADNVEVAVTSLECVHLLLRVPAAVELHSWHEWRAILADSAENQAIGRKIVRNIFNL